MSNVEMKKIVNNKILPFLAVIFLFGALFYSISFPVLADDLSNVEDDIEKVTNKIDKVQEQLDQSQNLYNLNQRQISTTQTLLVRTQAEISQKETDIKNLNQKIEWNKEILESYIREMSYEAKSDQMVGFAVSESFLSDFSVNFDQMISVKEKVLEVMSEIRQDKEELSGVKEQLADKKEDHEKLLTIKQMEQAEVKEDIQSAEASLTQLTSKLNQLRSRYSELLGKSISTKDIMEAANFAAKATGMNKSFLLGVLIQESNKGQSTGSCDYKQSKMPTNQLNAFKKICSNLDYDYKKMKVSCPPKNYKGTGGAMGVPQFMPTTWVAYEDDIASYTHSSTPDPWDLVDGVTAMAIKLSRDGAAKKTRFAEAKSYCVYLAGGNWGYYCFGSDKYKKSYNDVNCWGSSIRNYGEKVLCLKDNYEKYY